MALTAAQIAALYANVHAGATPSTAQTALFEPLAQASRSGQITDAQIQYYIVSTADADAAVALTAYQFFTGKTPTQAGVSFLVNSNTNPTDLNDPYYQTFSLENRYINFAQNLGLLGEGKEKFQQTYGGLTFAQTVQTAYETIIGSAYATAAGYDPAAAIADITARQGYFQQVANERFGGQDPAMAAKAAVVGYIMAEAIKADVGLYAAGVNNFLADLAPDGQAQFNNDLVTNYSAQTAGLSPSYHVVALTSGFDFPGGAGAVINTQGGAGNDLYIATSQTLSNDSINGGGGYDRLLITGLGSATYTATPQLANVEELTIAAAAGGGVVVDLANSSGVTNVVLTGGNAGTGPNDVGVAAMSVLNAGPSTTITADIDDMATAGVLTYSVKTEGANDSLTVNLRNTDTGGAATRNGLVALNVTGVETLTLNVQRASISGATVDTGDTVAINNISSPATTRLVITGDSAVSIGGVQSSFTGLTTVDASAMTKSVSLGSPGSGLSVAAAGADITTGLGDDSVTLFVATAGPAVLGPVNLGGQGALGDTLSLYGGTGPGLTVIDLSAGDQVAQVIGVANGALQTGAENIDIRNLAGTSQLTGSAGVNGIVGTQGADTITGGGGGDIIDVQGGADTLVMSALGQTGAAPTGNGGVAGLDLVTGLGVGDRISLSGLGVAALNGASATAGSTYLSGTSGTVALVEGTYNNATQSFAAGANGSDMLFVYDTNGAAASGLEGVVLLGSNAAINSVSADGSGMFTFA